MNRFRYLEDSNWESKGSVAVLGFLETTVGVPFCGRQKKMNWSCLFLERHVRRSMFRLGAAQPSCWGKPSRSGDDGVLIPTALWRFLNE